jgi:hypothetical protein
MVALRDRDDFFLLYRIQKPGFRTTCHQLSELMNAVIAFEHKCSEGIRFWNNLVGLAMADRFFASKYGFRNRVSQRFTTNF